MNKETLEEVAESKYGTDMDSHRGGPVYDLNADSKRAFVKGAKWMQDRMYSEEDMRNAIFTSFLLGVDRDNYSKELEDKLIEKFIKKQDE
tara:strand:+ start:353 stop:622 length:270 start_codon:yes stop_codon:yes gene_type:complete